MLAVRTDFTLYENIYTDMITIQSFPFNEISQTCISIDIQYLSCNHTNDLKLIHTQ